MSQRPRQTYAKKRRVANPRTPQVSYETKWCIDDWLEHLEAAAAKAAAKYRRSRYFAKSSIVRKSWRHWESVRRGLKWARGINRQRRATDE